MGDGDHVVLGGSGGDSASEADGAISGEEWVRRIEWVAPPASSCSLDSWWIVGAVGARPHSSRGPGHRPLKAETTGSNPVCGTNLANARSVAIPVGPIGP